MNRIPGGIRYTGADLGFDGLVIANGVTAEGLIVPWRARFPFTTVIAEVFLTAGNPNFIPRFNWVDWDGVTVRQVNQPFLNPGSTSNNWSYWLKDNQPRAVFGTPATSTIPMILGAPFAQLRISNNDVAPATFTFQIALLWDGGGPWGSPWS